MKAVSTVPSVSGWFTSLVTITGHLSLDPYMAVSNALRVLSALVSMAFLASCGAVITGSGASPSPGSTPEAGLIVATDSDSGKSFELHVGDRLEVKLASTYWNIHESSDLSVLKLAGPTATSTQRVRSWCGLRICDRVFRRGR